MVTDKTSDTVPLVNTAGAHTAHHIATTKCDNNKQLTSNNTRKKRKNPLVLLLYMVLLDLGSKR